MLPDYHIHTSLCKHAEGDLRDYHAVAQRYGMPEIAITDHLPNPDGYDPVNRMFINQFDEYQNMVAALRAQQSPTAVLFGGEVDYYTGCEKFLQSWLPHQKLDFVLGSVHYLDNWGFDNPDERAVWDAVNVTQTWRKYFGLIGKLAELRIADAVAHLDLPKKFNYRPSDRDLREMAQPALDRVAAAGMAIEINSSGLRRPVREIYPSPLLLELACERNIPICFGSDAHRPEEVGWEFAQSLELARNAGYTRAVRFQKRQSKPYDLPAKIGDVTSPANA